MHFSHIKHPLVGDPVYGNKRTIITKGNERLKRSLQTFRRQALHAAELTLAQHPLTGETLTWQAPLPNDFEKILQALIQNEQDTL